MMVCKFLKRVGLVLFSDVYVMDGNNYKAGQHFYKGCDNTHLGRWWLQWWWLLWWWYKLLKRIVFSDVCVMDGNYYKAGQQFYKGCDKICRCEDTSRNYVRCVDRCSAYTNIPQVNEKNQILWKWSSLKILHSFWGKISNWKLKLIRIRMRSSHNTILLHCIVVSRDYHSWVLIGIIPKCESRVFLLIIYQDRDIKIQDLSLSFSGSSSNNLWLRLLTFIRTGMPHGTRPQRPSVLWSSRVPTDCGRQYPQHRRLPDTCTTSIPWYHHRQRPATHPHVHPHLPSRIHRPYHHPATPPSHWVLLQGNHVQTGR